MDTITARPHPDNEKLLAWYAKEAPEEIIEPEDVANTYYHLHMQPRGVWTLDLDIRPWTTPAWFNTS